MRNQLPECVASYFAGQNLQQIFQPDAEVHDENKTHVGSQAIERWKAETDRTYQATTTPLAVESLVVVARVAGNFPGSPTNLRFHFQLNEGKIQRLEIGS